MHQKSNIDFFDFELENVNKILSQALDLMLATVDFPLLHKPTECSHSVPKCFESVRWKAQTQGYLTHIKSSACDQNFLIFFIETQKSRFLTFGMLSILRNFYSKVDLPLLHKPTECSQSVQNVFKACVGKPRHRAIQRTSNQVFATTLSKCHF